MNAIFTADAEIARQQQGDVVVSYEELQHRFEYHPPATRAREQEHANVRAACWRLAAELNTRLPDGREKSVALTRVEEALFWGNAAIARDTEDPAPSAG